MPDTFTLLSQQVLPAAATFSSVTVGSDGLVATGATPGGTIIRHMRVVNLTVGTPTVRMWILKSGDVTAGTEDVIMPEAELSSEGWAEFEGTIILDQGDKLFAQASAAAAITCSAYGLEMT